MSESAPRRFTLHVDFLATDERSALNQAEAYVEALNLLRLEVDGYTARVSRDGGWSASMPVYCGAPGPDPTDVCTERAGHPSPHSGPGITDRWNDDDLPRAPDTIEQVIGRFTHLNGAPSQRQPEDDPASNPGAETPPAKAPADAPSQHCESRPQPGVAPGSDRDPGPDPESSQKSGSDDEGGEPTCPG